MLEEKLWSHGVEVGSPRSSTASKADRAATKKITSALSNMANARGLMRKVDKSLAELRAVRGSTAAPTAKDLEEAHMVAIDYCRANVEERSPRRRSLSLSLFSGGRKS
jgi:hypothetical protein|tara:strand:- start:1968 stop:2291 length:324 start_codon:yes stop_codon:yes gene_type:complete